MVTVSPICLAASLAGMVVVCALAVNAAANTKAVENKSFFMAMNIAISHYVATQYFVSFSNYSKETQNIVPLQKNKMR